ncbi:peptide ABC transporter substrate-binding protein [Ktedonosporobacter rubrisoli]|uniref:Peptide ABC transporter substrate-binding protein n=1 Tax=Ktedonosporobacter rubrisoli TaxID=2509675 RepID=A0A4P6JHQ3_KTERU|nr:peptide ABC transporter substrate-binding protein [Ktedonosporobacter rubrisoli]QBD74555.1 peptide ABC transporter substrate-binding protein [Ktedonosporobacter rubrisoli]
MKLMQKSLLSLCLLCALLVAACGNDANSSQNTQHTKAPANKQVLSTVFAVGAGIPDFNTVDPALAYNIADVNAVSAIFTGLLTLDYNLRIHGQLAQSWDRSSDGLTWTFHLKPNLKFSDGTPLTSHDIAYSIDRALLPATKSTTALYYMGYIKNSDKLSNGAIKTIIGDSLLTPDDNTIKIVSSKPVPFFLETLTYPCAFTVEKRLIDAYGAQWTDHLTEGGSTGPFKVKRYIHNQEMDLIPDSNYYGAKPQLKELVYPFYKNEDTTYKDYMTDRLDDATIPLSNYSQDKTRKDFWKKPYLSIDYLAMNFSKKPFDNLHIRQAFALAINKTLLADKIWKGSYIATNHIIPEGQYGYYPNLSGPAGVKGPAGDPALAKKLLQQGMQEAGYSSINQIPQIALTYSSSGKQAFRDEMTALQQMWQQVLGVSVKLDDIDGNTLSSNTSNGVSANPYQFYAGHWAADYPDPQDWITIQFGKDAADNSMGFGQNNGANAASERALQQQMVTADLMQDSNARLATYNKIEQEIVDDIGWISIVQETQYGLRKPCVQGVRVNALQLTPPDDWGNVYISTDLPCANVTVS